MGQEAQRRIEGNKMIIEHEQEKSWETFRGLMDKYIKQGHDGDGEYLDFVDSVAEFVMRKGKVQKMPIDLQRAAHRLCGWNTIMCAPGVGIDTPVVDKGKRKNSKASLTVDGLLENDKVQVRSEDSTFFEGKTAYSKLARFSVPVGKTYIISVNGKGILPYVYTHKIVQDTRVSATRIAETSCHECDYNRGNKWHCGLCKVSFYDLGRLSHGCPRCSNVPELAASFGKLNKLITAQKAQEMNTVINFNIGEDYWWTVDMTRGPESNIRTGKRGASCTIIVPDKQDWIDIMRGDLSITSGFMMGKVKIKGDIGKAMTLKTLLSEGDGNN
jgi:putative sterol carrier protein